MTYATAIWSPPVFLLTILLTGCPEAPPTTDAPMPNNPAGSPGSDGALPPAPPQDGAAGGAAPGAGPATMPSLAVEPGTGVKLSGEFKYAGTAQGKNRVDFFQVGADGRPMILHAMTLDKPGPWELELPKALGKINVLAFIDAEGNGPQLAEPSAMIKDLDVEQAAMPGLTLTLADGAANDFATDSPTMLNPVPTNPPPSPQGAVGAPPAGGAAPGVPPADGAAAGPPGTPPAGAVAGAPPAGGAAPDKAAADKAAADKAAADKAAAEKAGKVK